MRRLGVFIVWLGAGGLMIGCNGVKKPPAEPGVDLEQENTRLKRQIIEQDKQIEGLKRQLARLRGMPSENLDQLVQVERVEFGRFTRAHDKDKDGFEDGIMVYLTPLDRYGDNIKVAGEVEMELWDLEAAEGERQMGQWHFGMEELRKYWLGGPLTDHFKFELDWPSGKRPAHEHLTVKLKFSEALTGKVFEIQKMVETRIH